MGAFAADERRYVRAARVGRLATADADGRPHVVPVCTALVGDDLVTPIDEKPKDAPPDALRRVRDVEANPRVAVVFDHYVPDWSHLGWVQVRGAAAPLAPGDDGHGAAVAALREKYDQYADRALPERPVLRIAVDGVRSWGHLDAPETDGRRD
ncbi:MAG: TIGR03668 family PPOX class F420-dependent oxidoreductase [Haloarculaceae archaeon]